MFETATDIPMFLSFLFNGILGFVYTGKFLKEKRSKTLTGLAWTAVYFAVLSVRYVYMSDVVWEMLLEIVCLLLLEIIFFHPGWSKRLFVTFSFLAGKEIVKYIISVVSVCLYSVLSDSLLQKVQAGEMTDLRRVNRMLSFYSVSIVTICEAIAVLLLAVYLVILTKKFVWTDYKLNSYQNTFLILPCVTALCIAITLRKVVILLDEEGSQIIYDRVPETKFWIPFICVLLLGTIISSVILFQKLAQCTEVTNYK